MPDKFTIASWPVDTTLQLCRVSWDVAYKDVVQFDSPAARAAYFASLDAASITLDHLTFCKMGEPIRINIPFADCYNYNYLVVSNPKLPTDGVTPPVLYYFITGIAFNSPNTTVLTLALDVWQTYLFTEDGGAGFTIGYSFLQRGHLPMKQAAAETTWSGGTAGSGYPVIPSDTKRAYLLAPEGMETGSEYLIGTREYLDLAVNKSISTDGKPWSVDWSIIIMSTTSLGSKWGDIDSPKLKTAHGNNADGLVGGCGVYAIAATNLVDFMAEVSDAPWVSSGIVSITAFPTGLIDFGAKINLNGGDTTIQCYKVKASDTGTRYYDSAHTIDDGFSAPINDYDSRLKYFTKLHTNPYTMLQLSNRNGQTLNLKPEMLSSTNLTLRAYSCASPANIRVGLAVSKYGEGGDTQQSYLFSNLVSQRKSGTIYGGYSTDTALWFDNFPQLSIVNDNYIAYLAGTTHSRQYAYDSASWGYERSSMAVNNMLNQTDLQMQTNEANRNVANQTALTGAAISAASSIFGGIAGGASGGIGGAVLGGLGGAASAGFGVAQTMNQLNGANLQFANNQAQLSQSAGMNAAYQNRANHGDYQNTIAGINAKVQDMALTQPSVVGANGGNGFALANGLMGVDIRWMIPQKQFAINVCNYWGRYGYAYNQYVNVGNDYNLGNFFTYWKLQDVYLTCAQADEGSKDVIRAVFEKGVTVWSDPAIIGTVDPLDNYFK